MTYKVQAPGWPLCVNCAAPVDDLHAEPIHYWTEIKACDPWHPQASTVAEVEESVIHANWPGGAQ